MDDASKRTSESRGRPLPFALALALCAVCLAVVRPPFRPRVVAAPDVSVTRSESEPRPSPLALPATSTAPRGSRVPLAKEAARVAADAGAAEERASVSIEQRPETFRLALRVLAQRRAQAAEVELTHVPLDGAATTARAATDAGGALALELAPGRVRLVAWSADALSKPLELELAHDTTAELELEPAAAVEGRVTDATSGAPVAGAEVAFWTAAELDIVRSDADGRFRHPRFPAGGPAQQVCVRAPGFGKCVRYLRVEADGAWKLAAATADEPGADGAGTPFLELALVPELRLSGRVLAADGTPLAGARVAAEGYFHARPSIAVRDLAETVSDAAGAFELAGLRSDIGHALVIEAPGHASLARELAPARVHELAELRLAPEALVAGLVVDPDGVPLSDVEVVLELAHDEPLSAARADAATRVLGRVLRARTDANGAFLFAGLAPVPLVVRASTADGLEADTELLPDGRGLFPPACLQVAALVPR